MAYDLVGLRDVIRQRLGWSATDTFVSNDELTNYINDSLAELHGFLLTVHRPGTFGTVDATLTILAGDDFAFLLPLTDFGRLLKVGMEWQDRIVPFSPGDRVTDVKHLNPIAYTPHNVRYYVSVDGSNSSLVFDWPAQADTAIVVTYLRSSPRLLVDSDSSWLGWDEYVILDVMLKCRDKEDDDGGALVQKKAHLEQRIRNHAEPLDMGHAATVVDMRAQDYYHDNTDRGWWRRWG